MSIASRLLEDAIAAEAAKGRSVQPVSFTIDYGAAGEGDLSIDARVDRATKSLVFASGEARFADGRAAATAQGVFRVTES